MATPHALCITRFEGASRHGIPLAEKYAAVIFAPSPTRKTLSPRFSVSRPSSSSESALSSVSLTGAPFWIRNMAWYTWFLLASITAQMVPPAETPCHAMASSVETPVHGFSSAHERPLTVAMPIRMPVKDPGPCAHAIRSISFSETPVFFSMSSAIGSRVLLCVSPLHWIDCANSSPSRTSAAEAAFAEDSKASVSIWLFSSSSH